MEQESVNDSRIPSPTGKGWEEAYRIGRMGKPHGVKGEISFHFDDDVFDRVESDFLFLDLDGILVPFFMDEYRFKSDETALVKFHDIDTEGRARELTGCDVYFPRHLADEDADNVSFSEIVGWTIINAKSGKTVGRVTAIDDSTINTLFEVALPDGQSALLPANPDLIEAIDKQSHTLIMTIAEGLLE